MKQSFVISARRAPSTRRAHPFAISLALGGAAFATYVAVTATLSQLTGGSALFQAPEQAAIGSGGPPSPRILPIGSGALPETAADQLASLTPMVLTITVDGPNPSVDVYCDTTPDHVALGRVHLPPEDVMDVYHQLCSGTSGES